MNAIPTQHPNTNPMFSFEGHDVRVVSIYNYHTKSTDPWFILVDVCKAMGVHLRTSRGQIEVNTSNVKAILRPDEITPCPTGGMRGPHAPYGISESGLYRLIMRSDKPAARRFQDWVTREVLPALRKDGMYVMGEEKVKTGEMSLEEMTLRVVEGLKAKTERLEVECENQRKIIEDHLLFVTVQEWQGQRATLLPDSGPPPVIVKFEPRCPPELPALPKVILELSTHPGGGCRYI